jgi:pilus assembly protein CpaC
VAQAAEPADAPKVKTTKPASPLHATQGPVRVEAPVRLTAGKSLVMSLPDKAVRISIANPDVADVMLLNPKEVYLLGKKTGATNLFVSSAGGATSLRDVSVHVDTDALQSRLREWVPTADGVQVDSVADTLVVRGRVADAMKAQRIMGLAEAFSGGRKAVNMLRVEGGQQVMLEVKVA